MISNNTVTTDNYTLSAKTAVVVDIRPFGEEKHDEKKHKMEHLQKMSGERSL